MLTQLQEKKNCDGKTLKYKWSEYIYIFFYNYNSLFCRRHLLKTFFLIYCGMLHPMIDELRPGNVCWDLWKSQIIFILIINVLWCHPGNLVGILSTYNLMGCSFCFHSYIHFDLLTHFRSIWPLYNLLKTPENDIFRGYKMGALTRNGKWNIRLF